MRLRLSNVITRQPAQQYQQPPHRVTIPRFVRSPTKRGGYEEPYPDEPADPNLAGAAAVPEGPPMVRQIQPPGGVAAAFRRSFRSAHGSECTAQRRRAVDDETVADDERSDRERHQPARSAPGHSRALEQNAGERFVFVNMRKYLEGETLKEGPSVERITAEGVILNQRGLRFLLPRQ